MTQGKEEAYFNAWRNELSWRGNKWEGQIGDFNPKGEFWGAIPAGKIVTINVKAQMSSYDNRMNTGELSYRAPQEVKYEIWYFSRNGGKVINVTNFTKNLEKPQPGILYYTEKECK